MSSPTTQEASFGKIDASLAQIANGVYDAVIQSFPSKLPSSLRDINYIAGHPQSLGAAAAFGTNVIRAIPFFAPFQGTINRIAVNVTIVAGAGGVLRLGLYSSDANFMPSALIADSGSIATDVGVGLKSFNPGVTTDGSLLWLVHLAGTSAATLSSCGIGSALFFGVDSALSSSQNFIFSGAFPFAALPASFPLAGSGYFNMQNNAPAILIRYN